MYSRLSGSLVYVNPTFCWRFLIRFPDGWRHIIPALLELGLRVIVPDMLGYGQTVSRLLLPGLFNVLIDV